VLSIVVADRGSAEDRQESLCFRIWPSDLKGSSRPPRPWQDQRIECPGRAQAGPARATEADVNYKVVKAFLEEVQEESLGEKVLKSVSPGQQIIKIIHDRLIDLLGGQHRPVRFAKPPAPTIWMMVGLQGSGKTTTCGKLAGRFAKAGRHPYLIAADLARPAAVEQLRTLGRQLDIPVYSGSANPWMSPSPDWPLPPRPGPT